MQIELSEEQVLLRDTVRRFAADVAVGAFDVREHGDGASRREGAEHRGHDPAPGLAGLPRHDREHDGRGGLDEHGRALVLRLRGEVAAFVGGEVADRGERRDLAVARDHARDRTRQQHAGEDDGEPPRPVDGGRRHDGEHQQQPDDRPQFEPGPPAAQPARVERRRHMALRRTGQGAVEGVEVGFSVHATRSRSG